jgi:hypothetical protein
VHISDAAFETAAGTDLLLIHNAPITDLNLFETLRIVAQALATK